MDWSRAKRLRLSNLQPSTTAISLRLPVSLLDEIKIAAHKRDVPYQFLLIKMWLSGEGGGHGVFPHREWGPLGATLRYRNLNYHWGIVAKLILKSL